MENSVFIIHAISTAYTFFYFTESQNGRGWMGPLEVTLSNPPAQAGSPRAGCPGPHPDGF